MEPDHRIRTSNIRMSTDVSYSGTVYLYVMFIILYLLLLSSRQHHIAVLWITGSFQCGGSTDVAIVLAIWSSWKQFRQQFTLRKLSMRVAGMHNTIEEFNWCWSCWLLIFRSAPPSYMQTYSSHNMNSLVFVIYREIEIKYLHNRSTGSL